MKHPPTLHGGLILRIHQKDELILLAQYRRMPEISSKVKKVVQTHFVNEMLKDSVNISG